MGEVIFFDKSKADVLASLGFKYNKREIDGRTAFIFIQTKELMKELGTNFESGSFCINSTVNF